MIEILANPEYEPVVNNQLLIDTAQAVLDELNNGPEVDLCISIEDDSTLADLNYKYLGVANPTDVLSFELNEHNPETGRQYLGDIIISYERVLDQSRNAGHSVEAELRLMVIHGILHLLGYDHSNLTQKAEMWRQQNKLLNQLGIEIIKIPED